MQYNRWFIEAILFSVYWMKYFYYYTYFDISFYLTAEFSIVRDNVLILSFFHNFLPIFLRHIVHFL